VWLKSRAITSAWEYGSRLKAGTTVNIGLIADVIAVSSPSLGSSRYQYVFDSNARPQQPAARRLPDVRPEIAMRGTERKDKVAA
jgi:hypothetical protein